MGQLVVNRQKLPNGRYEHQMVLRNLITEALGYKTVGPILDPAQLNEKAELTIHLGFTYSGIAAFVGRDNFPYFIAINRPTKSLMDVQLDIYGWDTKTSSVKFQRAFQLRACRGLI
jgi:hypothetical protein